MWNKTYLFPDVWQLLALYSAIFSYIDTHVLDNANPVPLTTNFFVSSKKHSIVFGGFAFREWIEYGESIIVELIDAIKDGASTEEQIVISHKHPFNSKLTSHPGEGVKIISIKFQECIDDENVGETVTDSDNLNESFNFSDMSHEILDVSSSSDLILDMDDSKGKLNSKVNAELKLLRQSIKIKDDKIKSLNNKVKELEKKLKSDSINYLI